jgi:hypothetical protein
VERAPRRGDAEQPQARRIPHCLDIVTYAPQRRRTHLRSSRFPQMQRDKSATISGKIEVNADSFATKVDGLTNRLHRRENAGSTTKEKS